MIAPSGRGIFLWQWSHCEGGNVAAVIAKARKCGFSFLVLHEFYSEDLVSRLHAAGLVVGFSFYSVPGDESTSKQITRAVDAVRCGIDFLACDAEIQWETHPDGKPGWRGAEAKDFAQGLRNAVGDVWIGDAGAWQWPFSHPLYPDREFAAVFDGAMIERYWSEFGPSMPYGASIATSEHQWATDPDVQGYKSIVPIGSCYGTNGQVPAGHQPLRLSDLSNFDSRYMSRAYWSWLHVPDFAWTWFEENPPDHNTLCDARPTLPALPDDTPDIPSTD